MWGIGDIATRIDLGEFSLAALFDEDMLGDDLEALLAEVGPPDELTLTLDVALYLTPSRPSRERKWSGRLNGPDSRSRESVEAIT